MLEYKFDLEGISQNKQSTLICLYVLAHKKCLPHWFIANLDSKKFISSGQKSHFQTIHDSRSECW